MTQKPYAIQHAQDCGDERGNMHVLSAGKELPFAVKRAFYMQRSTDTAVRGNHANLYATLAFVCLCGTCRLSIDDGGQIYNLTLGDPAQTVIVQPRTWKKLDHFSADCILLVLSDRLYEEDDILKDYDAFVRLCAAPHTERAERNKKAF